MTPSQFFHKAYMFFSFPLWKVKHNKISMCSEVSSGLVARYTIVGRYAYIGRNCTINNTIIGAYSCIAADVQIGGMEHPYWDLSLSPKLSDKFIFGTPTIIGHDVWIGAGSIIRQGVTIGDGAVVGANSFVNRDVPPYTIVAGSPARVIKERKIKKIERILNESKYWEENPKRAMEILKQIQDSGNIYE